MRPVKPLAYGNPEELPSAKLLECAAARARLFRALDDVVFWNCCLPLANTLYEYLDRAFVKDLK